jgi:hypothetical protein
MFSDSGVPNEELGPNVDQQEESDEETTGNDMLRGEMMRRSQHHHQQEVIPCKQMDEVRSKWEEGINSKQEELSEQRKLEMAKFR